MLQAKQKTSFSFVTEVSVPEQVDLLSDVADVFQVGSRSMYNYELLKKLSRSSKPVVLKRAFSATLDEWLSAADYLLKDDPQKKVWLCERGVRGFDTYFRNTLDINAIAYIAQKTPFSAMVDASHATGRAEFVKAGTLAGIAAGATAVMVEVHPHPKEALSDADQALDIEQFYALKRQSDSLYEHFQKV
jgi:3-deoxy-7-phosphoheptulonate synthase